MAANYYEFIGIAPGASDLEIRRACARKLRELAVARDEDGRRMLLNQVRPTLTDPHTRANYDAVQAHGDEIASLTDEALEAMGEQQWEEAIRRWKQVLVRMPDNEMAMAHLGMSYSMNEDHLRAIRVLEGLSARAQDAFAPWMYLGRARLSLGAIAAVWSDADEQFVRRCPECGSTSAVPLSGQMGILACPECGEKRCYCLRDRRDVLAEAVDCFERAADIQPWNAEPYTMAARCCMYAGDYDDALDWAERAVAADGESDVQDFEAFFLMCEVYSRAERPDDVLGTAERIRSVLPPDEDAHRYAAHRFAAHAHDCAQRLEFKSAELHLKVALAFSPEDADLAEYRRYCENGARALGELPELRMDYAIVAPVRYLAAVRMFQTFSAEDAGPGESEVKQALESVWTCSPADVLHSLSLLRVRYPAIHWSGEALFEEVRRVAGRAMGHSGQVSQVTWSCRQCLHRMPKSEWQGRVTHTSPGLFGMNIWYRCPKCGGSVELNTW